MQSALSHYQFEHILSRRSGVGIADLKTMRVELASVPAVKLAAQWFRRDSDLGRRFVGYMALRRHVRTRSVLFQWVYGHGSAIASDLLYVRLPSAEKRRLIGYLRTSMHADMPWLSSKLVHAMAFRPQAFDLAKRQQSNSMPHREQWGPLYRRVGISKGTRRRILDVPNPVLMRVQRGLLGLLGPSLERSLLPCVYGLSSGKSGPTFVNAAQHIGRHFVASFDLKNFFPSVRVADVIRGLQDVRSRGLPMFDRQFAPEGIAEGVEPKTLGWTDDAIVLISRLATRRSRLPQGAPMSPILASVAFTTFDRAIIHRLGAEFGAKEFTYTRYFDDLTVSLSGQAAKRRAMKSTAEVLQQVRQCIEDCLDGSSFRINESKSHCSQLTSPAKGGSQGQAHHGCHDVTGLVVRAGSVSLPRTTQRYIRNVIHRLDGENFVADARKWASMLGRSAPVFEGVVRGHRWKPTPNFHRKCSAERLAALMLQRLHPDIRVKAILKDWFAWQARIEDGDFERKGRAARPLLEWLLAVLWRGGLRVRQESKNSLVFAHDGTDVCTVSAESPLTFFGLASHDAIAVTEYWHHLTGVAGYLGACPDTPEFRSIHRWRDGLAECLQVLRLPDSAVVSAGPPAVGDTDAITLTMGEDFAKRADVVAGLMIQFQRDFPGTPQVSTREVIDALSQRAFNHDEFMDWICGVARYFVRRLPKLPPDDGNASHLNHADLFAYLRAQDDFARGRVRDGYTAIAKVDAELRLRSGAKPLPYCFGSWQMVILDSLSVFLGAIDTVRHDWQSRGGIGNWLDGLPDNPYCISPQTRAQVCAGQLEKLISEVRSEMGTPRLLGADGNGMSVSDWRLISDIADTRNNFDGWTHLAEVGKVLWAITGEVLEQDLHVGEVPKTGGGSSATQQRRNETWKRLIAVDGEVSQKWLRLIKPLRNKYAHGSSEDQRVDWVRLQKQIASNLGRTWTPTPEAQRTQSGYLDPSDLILTGYEVLVIKSMMLEALCSVLVIAKDRSLWISWRSQP
jgi:Reverse transcriptase (RNA-dependent DNA polymerase)